LIHIVFICVFFDLYIEFFPYCLFVSNSQVIGCEDRLRNDLYCVGWGVKLCSINQSCLPLFVYVGGCIWSIQWRPTAGYSQAVSVCPEWDAGCRWHRWSSHRPAVWAGSSAAGKTSHRNFGLLRPQMIGLLMKT